MITVIDIERHEETHLAQFNEGRYQRFESWAPDGARFLYEEWEETNAALIAGTTPSLFVWDVAENEGYEISPGIWGASWSPQGDHIAFLLLGNPTQDAQGRITATDFIPGQVSSLSTGLFNNHTNLSVTFAPIINRPFLALHATRRPAPTRPLVGEGRPLAAGQSRTTLVGAKAE